MPRSRDDAHALASSAPGFDDAAEAYLAGLTDLRVPVEVRLFGHNRCADDWQVGPRRLDEHVLYVTDSGQCQATWEDDRITIHPGTAMWLPPGLHHHLATSPANPLRTWHMRFVAPVLRRSAVLAPATAAVVEAVTALARAVALPTRSRAWRTRTRLALLLAAICEAETTPSGPHLDDATRHRVHDYLDRLAPDARPTAHDLARTAHMSPVWFSRCFKGSYGLSPRSWLKRRRIELAALAIAESNDSLAAIATRFGYAEYFRFSRQFREVMGCAPSRWRRRRGVR